jgi:hypothetical protein
VSSRPAARLSVAAVLVSVVLITGLLSAPGSAGADVVVGSEAITQPGSLTPLHAGGSGTLYGVQLPSGASCPGDTAHQGYRVYSYLVPKGISPTSVSFKTGRPSRWFGYIAYGAYYGAVNTAEGSGQIVGLPSQFTWARLTAKDLFPDGGHTATWEGGIACTTVDGVVTDYWNSQIVFTASTSDPRGFTWRVVADPTLAVSHTWLWVGVALVVLSVLLAALAVWLSHRRDPSTGGPPPVGSSGVDPPAGRSSATSPGPAREGDDVPERSTAGRS